MLRSKIQIGAGNIQNEKYFKPYNRDLFQTNKQGRQDKTRQDKARQDKTRQDKTSQDRAGQNRTGHNLKALNR